MQHQTHFRKLAATTLTVFTLTVFTLGAAVSAQAGSPKTIVAVFAEEDAQYAETITLYADGKYQQAETEKKTSLYRKYNPLSAVPGSVLSDPVLPRFKRDPKWAGTWRVLDKEGGQTITFETLASLPADAVIEVKGAMPFGITWERQRPNSTHGDRTIAASFFQAVPPVPAKK